MLVDFRCSSAVIRTADRQRGEFDNLAVGQVDRPKGDPEGVRRVPRRIIRPGALSEQLPLQLEFVRSRCEGAESPSFPTGAP
jgi:hypothetical protein